MLNEVMIESWLAYWGVYWATDDDEIPDPPPSFVRGFNAASETLTPVIATLVELMERSDKEEFGEACQPVTNGEWFGAIEDAKAVIASAQKTKKIGFRCTNCGKVFPTVEACIFGEKSHL